MEREHSPDSSPSPSDRPAAVPASAAASAADPQRRRRWLPAILTLLGGLIAWAVLVGIGTPFQVPEALTTQAAKMGLGITPEVEAEVARAQVAADYRNAALLFGIAGALISAFAALPVGIRRRSMASALSGLLVGALIGAVSGAAGGAFEIVVREQFIGPQIGSNAFAPILVHAAGWMIVGAGAGLAYGFLQRKRTLLAATGAGAGAGLIGGALFVPLATLAFPLEHVEAALPAGMWSRLLWIMLPAALVGVALSRTGPGQAAD